MLETIKDFFITWRRVRWGMVPKLEVAELHKQPLPAIFYVNRNDCYEASKVPADAKGEFAEYHLVRRVTISPNPPTIKEAE